MRFGKLITLLLFVILCMPARAADITGIWQTAKPQYVVTIAKTKIGYTGQWYCLGDVDGTLNGNPLNLAFDGRTVTITAIRTPGTFTGAVSQDGRTISGNWGAHDPNPLVLEHVAAKDAHPIDPSPHKVRFVTVQPGVKLEVLDWGGSGPPLIFLAGQGRTGHNFDSFALKFTGKHHVYAITRRGYGLSGEPPPTDENYDADRLADDVLAVMDALRIEKPVIAGHSIAGEELSSIGVRHPDKVGGLIYLDAAFGYAFYDPKNPLISDDVIVATVRRDLDQLGAAPPSRARALIAEIRDNLPGLEQELVSKVSSLEGRADPSEKPKQRALVGRAIDRNHHIYTGIKAPILILAADPQQCAPNCDTPVEKSWAATVAQHVAFVTSQYPGAHVVRLPYANHFVYRSNPDQVEREMNTFMDDLR